MKPMKISGACAVIAIVVGMMATASANANSPVSIAGSSPFPLADSATELASLNPVLVAETEALTRGGVPPSAAQAEIEVQSKVESANLIRKMKAALGNGFGEVWYENGSAQLYLGVTSPAAGRIAEAVAAREGLGPYVTEVLVESSSAALEAAQHRWNDRLADLLAQEEATTSILPEYNSVKIALGSSVPASERAALESEASSSQVNTTITVARHPNFRITPEAGRCAKFVAGKAYCDPTIAGGVTIEAANGEICTAGPAVLLKDLTKETTETFILTAGHCIEKGAGVGAKWYSWNKTAKKEEIGKAVAYLEESLGSKADVGVIKVENAFWKQAGLIPVIPAIAEWNAGEETEPFAVTGEVNSAKGGATCGSGQTSGYRCGVIKEAKKTIGKVERIAEVEKAVSAGGDSGSPWFSEVKKLVEGTHIGKNGVNPIFQEIEFSFAQLKAKIDLALLTTANEKRPPCPMK